MSSRPTALGLALFVTFLWSTSFVMIKVGLDELALPPLSFAGLRYSLEALILLPLALPALRRSRPWRASRPLVGSVVVLGLLLYAVTQGAQFAALVYLRRRPSGWFSTALAFTLWNQTLRTLTAVESSVINNLMLVQIALLAWVFLGEALSPIEIVGLAVALAGILVVQVAPAVRRRSVEAAPIEPTRG